MSSWALWPETGFCLLLSLILLHYPKLAHHCGKHSTLGRIYSFILRKPYSEAQTAPHHSLLSTRIVGMSHQPCTTLLPRSIYIIQGLWCSSKTVGTSTYWFLFVCCSSVLFETGFHYIVLASPEFSVWTKLVMSTFLCLLSAGNKDVHHQRLASFKF